MISADIPPPPPPPINIVLFYCEKLIESPSVAIEYIY